MQELWAAGLGLWVWRYWMIWAELGPTGLAIRIFRNKRMAVLCQVNPSRGLAPEPVIRQMRRDVATAQIRQQVFERDGWACVKCGQALSWALAEMDEKESRGRGGEVSVENGQTLCRPCHTGPGGKHDRHPQFTASK